MIDEEYGQRGRGVAAAEIIRNISLFEGLAPPEIDGVLCVCERVQFEPGACLMRQGQPADSAFILESGLVEVMTRLPGGGEATVATLGPGSVIGEMALLDSGSRLATVMAREPAAGYFLERDGFHMLLAQRNRAAFTIQARVTRTLCARLRELNARIVASDAPENVAPPADAPAAMASPGARGGPSFDVRAFLPVLAPFRGFSAGEIESLADLAQVLELGRGQVLFREGEASTACYVVVRGALEVTGVHNGLRHRVGVLGPGRLCGLNALIEGRPHSMSASARERATLLELGSSAFERLYAGNDRLAARFQGAIARELLQALARTISHLTRLISQSRIRGGRKDRKQAEVLEHALAVEDCRTA
jgi:CRP-like cAMP-binding protein